MNPIIDPLVKSFLVSGKLLWLPLSDPRPEVSKYMKPKDVEVIYKTIKRYCDNVNTDPYLPKVQVKLLKNREINDYNTMIITQLGPGNPNLKQILGIDSEVPGNPDAQQVLVINSEALRQCKSPASALDDLQDNEDI